MFFELLNSLLQTLSFGDIFGFFTDSFKCSDRCNGSSFTAIAAAMATQGYWAQADIIKFLQFSSFKDLAILFYVCSAAGGLISMALGMPPKLYLWFFMGPPLYQWLLIEPATVTGTRWEVATQVQNQSDVWKLAYTGIQNTREFMRVNNGFAITSMPNPFTGESIYLEPGAGAEVSWFFAYFDAVVSSVTQHLIAWFGPYSAVPGTGGAMRTGEQNGWFLMSDQKWGMLETITSAHVTDAALRDVFITFLSSECGDRFRTAVNLGNLTQANSAKGRNLPRGATGDTTVFWSAAEVTRVTDNFSIPTPSTLGNLFRDGAKSISAQGAPGSFLRASGLGGVVGASNDVLTRYGAAQMVTCSQLLYSIMVGFRWEAGHTYARLMAQAPPVVASGTDNIFGGAFKSTPIQMTPGMITGILFYGWEIPGSAGSFNFNVGGLSNSTFGMIGADRDEAQQQFLINLITTHIVKNELAIAPPVASARGSDSRESENFATIYTSTVGSKSKFGELYVWALMMPYLQGIFLYFLAIAYPFVTMAMVVPGWHRMLFSWMTFWVWVKLWDVGFAIVAMAERSIWAMLGNSSDAAAVFQRVNQMSDFGQVKVQCMGGSILGGTGMGVGKVPCQGNQVVDVLVKGHGGTSNMTFGEAVKMLDLSMLLGASMDLDRANAFYIYFMSALKFAVPVVVGQCVLGSKAAVAGMVKDFTGNAADAGRAAGSAFSAQKTAAMSANGASQAQAASLKAMRQQGLAAKILGAQNRGLEMGARGAAAQQESQGVGAMSQALSAGEKQQGAALRFMNTAARSRFAGSVLGEAFLGLGDSLGRPGPLATIPGNANGDSRMNAGLNGMNALRTMNSFNPGPGPGGGAKPGTASGVASGGSKPGAGGKAGKGSSSDITPAFGGAASGGGGASGGAQSSVNGGGAQGFAGGPGGILGRVKIDPNKVFAANNALGVANSAWSSWNEPRVMMLDAIQGIGDAQIASGFAGASAKLGALQSDYGIAGFGYSQQSQAYNMSGQRMQGGAEFGAAQSAWLDRANYANAAAGIGAAYGVQPGTISAGQKPDSLMGAAYQGQLGAEAAHISRYADEGGAFNQWLSGAQQQLYGSYGYGAVMNQYNLLSRTPAQALGEAITPIQTYDLMGARQDTAAFNMLPNSTVTLTKPLTGRIEHQERK